MELGLFPTSCGGSIPTSPLQFSIFEIGKPIAATVYKKYHYFGDKDFLNLYSYGAAFDGQVLAAISYGIPNAKNIKGLYESNEQNGVLEIVRLACSPECPKNTPSRLISVSIKLLKKKYPLRLLVTYADTAQGHTGSIYKASNFEYHGLTAQKTDFVQPDGKIRKIKGAKYSGMNGEWVPRSRKHLFSMRIK